MKQKTNTFIGYFMLFGLIRIKRDFCVGLEYTGDASPHFASVDALSKIEPFFRKWCTVKWIKTNHDNPEFAWSVPV